MITRQDIDAAYERIRQNIVNTPVTLSQTFSDLTGCQVFLKHELLQMTGSFKERGALNKLLSLSKAEKKRGVVAASAGNHAQALAYHGKRLGVPVKIVMPENTPIIKVASTKYWNAEVVLSGSSFDDAYAHSLDLARNEDLTYIHPFQDPLVIAGQGTIALEILSSLDTLDTILVPIGGGGLISGMAVYVKSIRPDIKIIGVESESCTAMNAAVKNGKPVTTPSKPSLADGIAVKQVGEINLNLVQKYVDDIIAISEDEIANAILLLLEIEKITVEGSGAVTLAALLNHKVPNQEGKRNLCLLSGGNIDVNILARIITRGLAFDGRTVQLTAVLRDVPGALIEILKVFYQNGANVLDVVHHHYSPSKHFGQISVSFTLETKDRDHIADIRHKLETLDYQIEWEN